MRHESCLNCRFPEAWDARLHTLIVTAESLGAMIHHHHTVRCGGCGAWWFDDLVMGGLGVPVPQRRDTGLCSCPEDRPQYTVSVIQVPQPEGQCSCTSARVEEFSLPVRLGKAGPA